jgi:hypothetical protein
MKIGVKQGLLLVEYGLDNSYVQCISHHLFTVNLTMNLPLGYGNVNSVFRVFQGIPPKFSILGYVLDIRIIQSIFNKQKALLYAHGCPQVNSLLGC